MRESEMHASALAYRSEMCKLMVHYKALRHRYGYGVHSPYAYMLATEVLHLPRGCAYYDEYAAMLFAASYRSAILLPLLHYAWRFGYSDFSMETDAECRKKWLALAGKRNWQAPSIVVCKTRESALGYIPASEQIVAFEGFATEIVDAIKCHYATGVLFYGKSGLIYFPNPKVRFVAYEYLF